MNGDHPTLSFLGGILIVLAVFILITTVGLELALNNFENNGQKVLASEKKPQSFNDINKQKISFETAGNFLNIYSSIGDGQPILMSQLLIERLISDISYNNDLLFLGDNDGGISIIDIKSLKNPFYLTYFKIKDCGDQSKTTVNLSRPIIYTAACGKLYVINFTNKFSPLILNELDLLTDSVNKLDWQNNKLSIFYSTPKFAQYWDVSDDLNFQPLVF